MPFFQPHHNTSLDTAISAQPKLRSAKELQKRIKEIEACVKGEQSCGVEAAKFLPELLELEDEVVTQLLAPSRIHLVRKISWRLLMGDRLGEPLPEELAESIKEFQRSLVTLQAPVENILTRISEGTPPSKEMLSIYGDDSLEGLSIVEVGAQLRRRMEVFDEIDSFVKDSVTLAMLLRSGADAGYSIYKSGRKIIPIGDFDRHDLMFALYHGFSLASRISMGFSGVGLNLLQDLSQICYSGSSQPPEEASLTPSKELSPQELESLREDLLETFSNIESEINDQCSALLLTEEPSLASVKRSLVAVKEFLGHTIAALRRLEEATPEDADLEGPISKRFQFAISEGIAATSRFYIARNSFVKVVRKMLEPALHEVLERRTEMGVTNDSWEYLRDSLEFTQRLAPMLLEYCRQADTFTHALESRATLAYLIAIAETLQEAVERMSDE